MRPGKTSVTLPTTVAPMDDEGYFSFGTNSDYSCVLSQCSTRVVVEVNRLMPAVRGPGRIHISEVAAIVEHDTPLEEFPVAPAKELDPMVARSFRVFRRARNRGETSVTVENG